jgi:hypothetical protein
VDPKRTIKINGHKRTWDEIINDPDKETWSITPGQNVESFKDQLDGYQNIWKLHGGKICQKIGENIKDDGRSFREFIQLYNQNKKDISSHYIIAIDESGSMSGTFYKQAVEGVLKFLRTLKAGVYESACFVSILTFDDAFKVHHSCVSLKDLPAVDLPFSGGNTDFSPVLKECVNLAGKLKDEVEMTRILFYTDGLAPYPKKEINAISELIKEDEMDLKLHYVFKNKVEDKKSPNVFMKSIDCLGSSNCTLMSEVEPEMLGNKFIEIFDLDLD